MNKKLKSIVMALAICVLGYTQIGCQSDNIKNENKQEVKDYSTQANSENKNNTNSNINNSDSNNVVSNVHKLSSNSEIHFIDTGNSDAILIIKDNEAALIDGGDNDDESLVSSYITKQGISKLKYVFATHLHADHIGGLDKVVKDIKRIDVNKLDGLVEWFDDLLHEYQHLTGYSDTRINRLCILLNRQINKLKKLIV